MHRERFHSIPRDIKDKEKGGKVINILLLKVDQYGGHDVT